MRLENLESKVKIIKIKSFIRKTVFEIFQFSMVFASVLIIGIVFINFNLFNTRVKEAFGIEENMKANIAQDISNISTKVNMNKIGVYQQSAIGKINESKTTKEDQIIRYLDEKIDNIEVKEGSNMYDKDVNMYLKEKINKYSFNFNLLPPDNRLLISDIGVNAPLLDVFVKDTEKLIKADFDEELYKGVVKYPYTPDPGNEGNILIFGHTSYYWWKKNPYGEVFSDIWKLKKGQLIKIVRQGSVYEYEVVQKVIRSPKYVKKVIDDNSNGKYLTLMGCYPIGTDKQRILVIAKQKDDIIKTLALNR